MRTWGMVGAKAELPLRIGVEVGEGEGEVVMTVDSRSPRRSEFETKLY